MFSTLVNRLRHNVPVTLLTAAVATAATAFETARMQLPPDFVAVAERIPASGFGGANRGRYAIDEFHGDFSRTESRLAVFDPGYVANYGSSSFTLESPGLEVDVRAECRFKERVVTVGVLTFDARKLAYVCDITSDEGPIGSLTVGQPKPAGLTARMLARAERRGLAEIGGLTVEIVSVHQYEGSRIGSQTAVGYLLSVNAEVVGAVELTDVEPTFVLRSAAAPEVRRATLIAALGLAVLRDPANSTLGD